MQGAAEQSFTGSRTGPRDSDFPVTVPEPARRGRANCASRCDATPISASDAVEIDLPVQPDRPPRAPARYRRHRGRREHEPARDRREPSRRIASRASVTVAADPAVVRLVAGLNSLVEYPYGCTEQRISLALRGSRAESRSRRFSRPPVSRAASQLTCIIRCSAIAAEHRSATASSPSGRARAAMSR